MNMYLSTTTTSSSSSSSSSLCASFWRLNRHPGVVRNKSETGQKHAKRSLCPCPSIYLLVYLSIDPPFVHWSIFIPNIKIYIYLWICTYLLVVVVVGVGVLVVVVVAFVLLFEDWIGIPEWSETSQKQVRNMQRGAFAHVHPSICWFIFP